MLLGRASQLVPDNGVDPVATLVPGVGQSSTQLNSTQLSGNTTACSVLILPSRHLFVTYVRQASSELEAILANSAWQEDNAIRYTSTTAFFAVARCDIPSVRVI